MSDDSLNTRPTSGYYKRRQIVLTPDRQGGGTWGCTFTVIEALKTSFRSYSGCTEESFATPSEARAAALQMAVKRIDSA
ncbi:MAG: hypothetical protein H8K04_14930 [Nitrospira sp.]